MIVLILAAVTALAAADASAMGFGKVPQAAVLGAPLDLVIPLRLDAGETLAPECVAAEVTVGDQRVPPDRVRSRVDTVDGGEAIVRVVTTMTIDEPVVAVNVSVGCPVRLSRRVVLLADPTPATFSAPLTFTAPSLPAAPEPPRPVPATSLMTGERADGSPLAGAERVPAAAASAPRPRASAPRPPRSVRVAEGPGRAGASNAPRLKLDPAEPPATAVAKPAAAAPAEVHDNEPGTAALAASAASAATQRMAALEQSLEKLRAEAKADREAMATMRVRTAEAEMLARWTPYLLVLLGLMALVVAWLAVKLRTLNRERQQDWIKAVKTEEVATATPSPMTTSLPSDLASESPPPPFIPTRPGPAGTMMSQLDNPESEPWTQRTQRLPPPAPALSRDEPQASRAVSIEELIDLEQQAEFFIVLGQEEAAIDLLVDHVRSTGGGSPLPYLKLLEIYRRRNEREAYDRTRARFNHRFNAVAPDWDEDVQHGRLLEDYPNIIARLQMAWPAPMDAMAELESLLFRKSRGELFDMPAYRDLLFLYSLARDLLDREPLESGHVDVLLPLTEGATFTEPMPLEDSPEGLPSGLGDFEAQATVPVDLDLTQPAMPDSIFGEPTEPLRRR